MTEKLNPRSALVRGVVALVAFVALGYLAIQLVPGSGARLADTSPGWIAACVALELLACAGFAACFWATFSYAPHHVGRARSAQIALGELAAFAVVPTGVAAPLIRLWALRGGGMPLRTIFVRSVVHGPMLNVPYATAALLLGLGVLVGAGPGRAPLTVALAPIVIVLAAVSAATALTLSGRRRRRSLDVSGWRRIAREAATIVPDGVRQIPARARHPAALGGALVWWAGDCAVLWAAFQAVGASPPLAVVALGYMLGQLGTTLPLPGGVGGVEPIMLGVLVASGVQADVGAAAIVVYRAVALGLQSAVGAVALSLLIPSVRREKERARSAEPG